ncbi:hypothetical protein [Butyrivibrio sp. XPD2002]|uniref:hypothetical protein n=1 Tax=Butyrivibrio sp. XPD2002 TaxID=1280665 RepID=UPI000413A468|nr:hypothetical protein [Butyrivibrio sp. XPD2002]
MVNKKITEFNIEIPSNFWYYLTFVLWFGSEIFFKSTLEYINEMPKSVYEDRVTVLVSIMLVVQIVFFQSYTKYDMAIISSITALVLIATINSGFQYLLAAWLFIVASKKCHLKQMAKVAFVVLTVGIVFVIFLYKINYIPDYVMYRHGMPRHSLGFAHPNQLGLRVFQWILCFSYAFWDSFGLAHFTVVGVVGYWMHRVTDSQTATICVLAYITLILILKILERKESNLIDYVNVILRIGSALIGILSILFTVVDIRLIPTLGLIDQLISRRFYWAHKVYKRFGSSLLGKKFSTAAVENGIIRIRARMYFDNGYANLWLRFGTIIFVLFIVGYYLLMKKNAKNRLLLVILFIYSIYGIMEAGLVQLTHNVFLLAFAQVIYKDNSYVEESSLERKLVFKL